MVWFQCDDCGENIKKPKLPSHFHACRASKLSCIDCGVTFNRQSVQFHTQCVSEAQKYGPKGEAGNNSNGSNAHEKNGKGSRQSSDLDFSMGLSVVPPWICSLCNVRASSEESLGLHSQGKKHVAKVRAATARNASLLGFGSSAQGGLKSDDQKVKDKPWDGEEDKFKSADAEFNGKGGSDNGNGIEKKDAKLKRKRKKDEEGEFATENVVPETVASLEGEPGLNGLSPNGSRKKTRKEKFSSGSAPSENQSERESRKAALLEDISDKKSREEKSLSGTAPLEDHPDKKTRTEKSSSGTVPSEDQSDKKARKEQSLRGTAPSEDQSNKKTKKEKSSSETSPSKNPSDKTTRKEKSLGRTLLSEDQSDKKMRNEKSFGGSAPSEGQSDMKSRKEKSFSGTAPSEDHFEKKPRKEKSLFRTVPSEDQSLKITRKESSLSETTLAEAQNTGCVLSEGEEVEEAAARVLNLVKWKRLIRKELGVHADKAMKLKELRQRVLCLAQEAAVSAGIVADVKSLKLELMRRISSSSEFWVEGKLIKLRMAKVS